MSRQPPAPWAAPDTAPPQPAAGPSGAFASPTEPGTPSDPGRDRPLPPVPVALGPMTTADLLDGAFAILKRRPREVLTIAALLVIPIELVSAVLLRDVVGDLGLSGLADPSTIFRPVEDDATASVVAGLLTFAIGTVSLALLTGALAVMVDAWYRGERVGAGQAVRASLRRGWPLLAGVVLVHLFEILGFVLMMVGAYVVMALCQVVSPVVAVEGLGPFAAIRRSMSLTRRRLGAALVVPALVALVGSLVGFGLQTVAEVVAVAVSEDWGWFVRSVGQIASQLLVVPFTAGVAVLFHLDLRIRVEAHDIELRSHVVLAR